MMICSYPLPCSLPDGHQQHYPNEENMSEACFQNYEALVIMHDQI